MQAIATILNDFKDGASPDASISPVEFITSVFVIQTHLWACQVENMKVRVFIWQRFFGKENDLRQTINVNQ